MDQGERRRLLEDVNVMDDNPLEDERLANVWRTRDIVAEVAASPALRSMLQEAYERAVAAMKAMLVVDPDKPDALERYRAARTDYRVAVGIGETLRGVLHRGAVAEQSLRDTEQFPGEEPPFDV